MLSTGQRAAASLATGFALFSVTPEGPIPHENIPAQPLSVAETINRAGKATPYLYSGRPSENLDHLWPDRKKSTPPRSLSNGPNISEEYRAAFTRLNEICPALSPDAGASTDVASWFLETVKDLETAQQAPRKFLEAAYHAIGWSQSGTQKTKALTILQKAIADSPDYIAYIEERRKVLELRLSDDPDLQLSDEQWQSSTDTEREKILGKVSRLALSTLLPHNEIDFPRVIYARTTYPKDADYGSYSATFNEVYADGKRPLIDKSFIFAKQITIHETFHAFVSMLAQWYADGKLQRNPGLQRQGKFYQLAVLQGGAAISAKDSSEGYLTDPNERGARAFQLAAGRQSFSKIQIDMFTFRYENGETRVIPPPVFTPNSSDGLIPAACLAR